MSMLRGYSGRGVGNEMKERESRKRGVGCHIRGPCVPRCCKLSLELFLCGFISKCLFNIYGRVNKTSIREAFVESCRLLGAAVSGFSLVLGQYERVPGERDEGRRVGRLGKITKRQTADSFWIR